jgi:proline iminopeptidase
MSVPQQREPQEGKVPRDGFDLHYRIVGAGGPYLLVLSGGPGTAIRYMQPFADELGRTHRCIMLEQRGTGRSVLKAYDRGTINLSTYVDDIEALRTHLKLDRLALIGNSWGMMLALAYGGMYPSRARAIVTVGSGSITAEYAEVFHDNLMGRLSPSEAKTARQWMNRRSVEPELAMYEWFRVVLPGYYYDRKVALDQAMEWRVDDFNPEVDSVAGGSIFTGLDLRPQLRCIIAPTLLVQGRQDCMGEANVYEAHLLIKGSKLKFVNRCGHFPWLDQPDQTWQIIHEFLKGLPE